MSGTRQRGFNVVEQAEVPPPPPAADVQPPAAFMFQARAIAMGLQVLSQKALVGLSALFTAALVASAWLLWWSVLPSPTTPQLVGLGGYAVFVLLVEIVRRRSA